MTLEELIDKTENVEMLSIIPLCDGVTGGKDAVTSKAWYLARKGCEVKSVNVGLRDGKAELKIEIIK